RANQNESINHGRNHDQEQTGAPQFKVAKKQRPALSEKYLSHEYCQEAADDQSARPPGMKNIEEMRLIARVHCCNQRVDANLGRSISATHDKSETPKPVVIVPCSFPLSQNLARKN